MWQSEVWGGPPVCRTNLGGEAEVLILVCPLPVDEMV